MTQSNDHVYAIEPVPPPRQVIRPLNGGANRGAIQNVPAFAEFNRESSRAVLEPQYVDPIPGRAATLRDDVVLNGILARAIEGRVEDIVLAQPADSEDPIILNLDRASAIARVLRTTAHAGRPTLGYLLIQLPSGRLWGLRFVLEASDQEARIAAIAFFERLAEVSERNTSGAILGDQADPSHTLLEPRIREWFKEHTKANLAKLVAGVEPATNTFEVTNGYDTMPLLISVRGQWSAPLALAEEVAANPSMPIRRGTLFVLAEVSHDGIRFHEVRRRTDDRVTVSGEETIDSATIDAALEERKQRAAEALARAERETLSRRNPVWTTD